ncbi:MULTISPECIES: glycoside hydrolase family 15 protein [Dysgonomonas]|mgnify:FL=1|uniref:glycoside hydrolase family 15 protein n=1 Tax=Dysgonomonas TaxID=156973 RepID=UPI0009279D8B|nr:MULTISPECIES: glycoside hydrolase family 15 protein [Dysgonomonas]MBN9300356.1 glycoside hydrolase family 15 protein [Dysgonomonas mossii]OJX57485.1 MAG: glycoside hydrolase [Dysgonomonas sp. 37-18]
MDNLDYGVVGNCKTAALISKEGSIDWLCFPVFDSPSVFSKLLDKDKGGSFSFIVSDSYRITQNYFKETNILCTRFASDEGVFEVLDFMPRYKTRGDEYYIPSEIYRYIRLIDGKPRFRINYTPVMNYARDSVIHKKFAYFIRTFSLVDGNDNIYLYSSIDFDTILNQEEIILEQDQYMLLSYSQKLANIDINRAYLEYQRTKIYWLNWNNRSRKFIEYNDYICRSLLALKLMCYESSGAIMAALTTSIPETIGEVRNWDYRFCWIRDASMSIETLIELGHHSTAKRFMSFVKDILKSKSDSLQIMYGIDGSRTLKEEILPHLAGYENSQPVRIGNAAYFQKQNDTFGYLMDVIHSYYFRFPGTLGELEEMWEVVKSIVRTVYMVWRNPDQSIWEFRNIEKNFVFSKVMCWVALDRAIEIAKLLNQTDYVSAWQKEAMAIKEDVMQNGWNDQIQSFTQAYDNTHMDSSLLLMEQYGFIDANDDRYIKTVKRIKEELYHNGLMYRYKVDDDFGLPSSAFTICTFWLTRALFMIGEKGEARKIFDQLLEYSNHLGLFSEDLDFETKRMLGNFPQAYSHLALIDTALLFSEERKYINFIKP